MLIIIHKIKQELVWVGVAASSDSHPTFIWLLETDGGLVNVDGNMSQMSHSHINTSTNNVRR